MEALSFALFSKEMVLFFFSEWFIDMSENESYQDNSCNSQGKHVQQKYHVENKFNFVSRKEMELKIS